jgi:ATP-binding cassette subfamily F protein 3
MILSCSNICKSFGENDILKQVSFHIEDHEKAAIVGINGAGKSTLLKVLIGKLAADDGVVTWAKGASIGYLAQHQDLEGAETIYDALLEVKKPVIQMEARIRSLELEMKSASGDELEAKLSEYSRLNHEFEMADGYSYQSEITGVLKGLGFTEDEFSKPITALSGGQKTRVSLGKLLLTKPDILLLDEPTNHLDMESIAWLETYLRNYSGAVIIVAHDRYFLDRVVTKIIELDMGHCTVFSGNYSAYSNKKAMLRDAAIRAYLNQQQEIRHQEAVIAKLKSFNREKSIKRAESREKMLDKIDRLEKPVQTNDSMDIRLEPDVVSGNDVLTVTGLSKSFDTQTLFTNVDFEIKRGERVAVIGNNGTGKTTLLKIINGIIPADSGQIRLGSKVHIGYYDQEHQVLHMDKTLFQEIQDTYPNMNNTQIRNTLAAFLFTGDDVFKLIRDLSGGERGRVSLAKLMLSDANFLLLDEPTNHLDITSKEILESALNRYTGTVLYVSHDRYFINRTATRILDLTNGSFINYIGNYDYYLEKKEDVEAAFAARQMAQTAANHPTGTNSPQATSTASGISSSRTSQTAMTASSAGSPADGKIDWKAQKEEQARLRKRQNELKKIEDKIHELETRDGEIDELLSQEDVYTDVSRLMELNKEKESIQKELEVLYEKWEELAE